MRTLLTVFLLATLAGIKIPEGRIIDGRESVTFLVNVKAMLEDPAKMLFGGKDAVEALLNL